MPGHGFAPAFGSALARSVAFGKLLGNTAMKSSGRVSHVYSYLNAQFAALQVPENLLADFVSVARAKCEQHIAGLDQVEQRRDSGAQVAGRVYIGVGDSADEGGAVDAQRVGLARCVDIADPHDIGGAKRRGPVVEQRKRARVGVRLKIDDDSPAEIAAAGGCEIDPNLGRMVRVVVDDRHAAGLTF